MLIPEESARNINCRPGVTCCRSATMHSAGTNMLAVYSGDYYAGSWPETRHDGSVVYFREFMLLLPYHIYR